MEPQKLSPSTLPGAGAFDSTSYLASPPVCYDPTVSAAAFGVTPKIEELDPNLIDKSRRKAAIWCTVLIALGLVISTTAILGICKVLDPRPHV